jgi:phenylalanine-4-hydroxylase
VFYGSLADRVFHSTQYADPDIAEVKRLAGEAARRCETAEGLQYLADVFWFTIEFGVMWEQGELRCYGAGLLSSYGEIEEFRGAEIRPVDFHEMATLEYDITHYQPILFACDGMGELTDRVGGFFADFDDDTPARLAPKRAALRT